MTDGKSKRRGTQRMVRRESISGRSTVARGGRGSSAAPAATGRDLDVDGGRTNPAAPESGVVPLPVEAGNRGSAVRSTRLNQAALSAGRGQLTPRGASLRRKFMFVFAGVTAVSLISLGIILSWVSNFFLFSQTQHKGVELAKMTAALYQSINDYALEEGWNGTQCQVALERYLKAALTWGSAEPGVWSHINATNCGGLEKLSALGVGPPNTQRQLSNASDRMYIAGLGFIRLEDDVKYFEFDKVLEDRSTIRAYRFQVGIRQRDGKTWMPPDSHFVTVDMDIGNVYAVRNMLIIVIAAFLLVSLVVVLIIANLMANKITRPVRILLHDINQVAQGDLDHQTKAHSDDEIGMLATAFNTMTLDLKDATAVLVEQEAEQKRAEYEMVTAREVQQQLLPAQQPSVPGYEIESFYRGAKAVSGDYYDFINLGGGLVGLIIADVSGKGIPGSMVMAVMRTIVRLIAVQHADGAADTLKRTNRLIARQIKRGMFITAFFAILDTNTHQVTFASAGHNPMVVFRAEQQGYELANAKGIAIGFDPGPLFDKNLEEYRIQLLPGDALVLYTDGFPEAMNGSGQEFGDQNFYQTIALSGQRPAGEMVKSILSTIEQHRGAAEQSDDLTMIVVRRTP